MALTLAQIETAIADVLTSGQSTTQDGTTYTAASMAVLQSMRDDAKMETAAAAGTRPLFRAVSFTTMGYTR